MDIEKASLLCDLKFSKINSRLKFLIIVVIRITLKLAVWSVGLVAGDQIKMLGLCSTYGDD